MWPLRGTTLRHLIRVSSVTCAQHLASKPTAINWWILVREWIRLNLNLSQHMDNHRWANNFSWFSLLCCQYHPVLHFNSHGFHRQPSQCSQCWKLCIRMLDSMVSAMVWSKNQRSCQFFLWALSWVDRKLEEAYDHSMHQLPPFQIPKCYKDSQCCYDS